MSDRDRTASLDEIEDEIAALQERTGRYRRAMLGSRIVILAGLAILGGAYTIVPALGSATIVIGAIAAVIGATVWLGATKSSKEELDVTLASREAERTRLFDRVATDNEWDADRA